LKFVVEALSHSGYLKDIFILLLLFLGWQPGIQESAADWDEDWDKFEDEGMQK
jgi:epidermal growth factor receptor substrate 15